MYNIHYKYVFVWIQRCITPNNCDDWWHLPLDKLHWECEDSDFHLHLLKIIPTNQLPYSIVTLSFYFTSEFWDRKHKKAVRLKSGISTTLRLIQYCVLSSSTLMQQTKLYDIDFPKHVSYGIRHSCIKHHYNPALVLTVAAATFFKKKFCTAKGIQHLNLKINPTVTLNLFLIIFSVKPLGHL